MKKFIAAALVLCGLLMFTGCEKIVITIGTTTQQTTPVVQNTTASSVLPTVTSTTTQPTTVTTQPTTQTTTATTTATTTRPTIKPSTKPAAKEGVWSGKVGTGFDGGIGTQDDPYRIRTGEQLAYLSNEVYNGNSYEGKYFWLTADLDLAMINWKPIGTLSYPFKGVFDGGYHTIKNLSVTEVEVVRENEHSSRTAYWGLFGLCVNATFSNLRLDNVVLGNSDPNTAFYGYYGALAGKLSSNSEASISNVLVNGVNVCIAQHSTYGYMYAGGCVGSVTVTVSKGRMQLTHIQSTNIKIQTAYKKYNRMGGLFGNVSNAGTLSLVEFASYVKMEAPVGICSQGAIGYLYCGDGTVEIMEGFSKVEFNTYKPTEKGENYSVSSYALVGEASQSDAATGSVLCQNVYGYLCNVYTQFKDLTSTTSIWSVRLCMGCTQVPTVHGFMVDAWDLSDMSAPKLK